jgi:hypothetical protein
MNANEKKRIEKLLQQALPSVASDAEPARDLWPAVLRRLDATPALSPKTGAWRFGSSLDSWFDGALLAGLAVFVAFFPASIPVLLYYL